jgi:small-conductance mechanosensitive channel
MNMAWMDTKFLPAVQAVVVMGAGIIVAKIASTATRRIATKHLSSHHAQLTRRVIFYTILVLFAIMALRQLGFDLSVLLGAAGIFSVAIGFASQTAASNLISGLFLIGEKPFSVKDIVKIGNTTGEVLSIDLLSIKLRTFDNLFVRIPNETVMKAEVTTLTRFPIRRLDLKIGVAYKEDISRVRNELMRIATHNPLCLDEPEPLFIFLGFGASSLDIQFSVWAARENFLQLMNSIQEEIKTAFDASGIEIPFPHLSLYSGSVTQPFPVRVVKDEGGS